MNVLLQIAAVDGDKEGQNEQNVEKDELNKNDNNNKDGGESENITMVFYETCCGCTSAQFPYILLSLES